MQDSFDVHGSAGPGPAPLLDFERLDVYRVALEFQALASSIALPQGCRELRDQLDRAALSIVLNTAEGAGRTGAADKARSFAMARGSARAALEHELNRIRSSWLDGIAKVVTAPVGATVSVLPAEVRLSGAEGATGVRLVNDESAPAFKAVRTDLLYPYRQKELVAQVNALLGAPAISGHDVQSVRKAHGVDGQPNFHYKPQYSSAQYSQAFAEWMVEQFRADPDFFAKARETAKKHSVS